MTIQPRDVAKAFIRPYVERGDPYEHLKMGEMGAYRHAWAAKIGSAPIPGLPRARYGADTLRVLRVDGVDCCHTFSLRELYDEIRDGVEQAVMPL